MLDFEGLFTLWAGIGTFIRVASHMSEEIMFSEKFGVTNLQIKKIRVKLCIMYIFSKNCGVKHVKLFLKSYRTFELFYPHVRNLMSF